VGGAGMSYKEPGTKPGTGAVGIFGIIVYLKEADEVGHGTERSGFIG
jgi:hypothetical protein